MDLFFWHLKQDFYSGSIKRDLRGVFGLHATDKIFLYVYHELSMTFLFETLSKIFMIILSFGGGLNIVQQYQLSPLT